MDQGSEGTGTNIFTVLLSADTTTVVTGVNIFS